MSIIKTSIEFKNNWFHHHPHHHHLCMINFHDVQTSRWAEGVVPEPYTSTSSLSPRFYGKFTCVVWRYFPCKPKTLFGVVLFDKKNYLSQSRRHGQMRHAAYHEVPGALARSIQTKEAKYKLVGCVNLHLLGISIHFFHIPPFSEFILLIKIFSKIKVCYYGAWSVYRPKPLNFGVGDIDPFSCTHLIYRWARVKISR